MDGMDALAVKQATAFAKAYVVENGPLVMEMVRSSIAHVGFRNAVKLSIPLCPAGLHINTRPV